MTTSKDLEVKRAGRPRKVEASLVGDLGRFLVASAYKAGAGPKLLKWPSPGFALDPVAFARDILGVELWDKQRQILEAIRDHKRVAIAGGRKIGKDYVCGCAALWWYCSFEDARVVMTATRAKQVDDVLWRDIKKLLREHGVCVACKKADPLWRDKPRPCPHSGIIEDLPGMLARTGLKSPDLREIVGYTAAEAEGIAGVSGSRLLYLIDEASAYPDDLHTAIRGNLASGESREVMISNPTRTMGKFFDAFHGSKRFYFTLQVSSEDSPNVTAGREVIPGLASLDWIQEQREEWGRDSALYKIHVRGEFVLNEDGKIIPVALVTEATHAWSTVNADGPLRVGIDPAGPGGHGDESAFAVRRGKKVLEVHTRRCLDESGHLVEALGLIAKYAVDGEELAMIIVDSDGLEGAKVYGTLVAHAHSKPENAQPYKLVRVRGSEKARRQPGLYDKVRDELWGSLAAWLRDGGAIPEDAKLQRDLNAPAWIGQVNGRVKVTSKDELRKILNRSPDRADAVALACWEPIDLEERAQAQIVTRAEVERQRHEQGFAGDDPYRASDGYDPYAAHAPPRRRS